MNLKEYWIQITFCSLLVCEIVFFGLPLIALIPNPELKYLAVLLMTPIVPLLVIFGITRKIHGKEMWKELGFKPLNKNDLKPILSAIPCFIACAGATCIVKIFGYEPPPQQLVSIAHSSSVWLFIAVLFSAGVLAPLSEELIFRCITGGFFKKLFPEQRWIYYVFPSVLFALCHGIIWQSVLMFFLALYLQKHFTAGSTTRVILMHSLFNWCSLILLILTRVGIIPSSL